MIWQACNLASYMNYWEFSNFFKDKTSALVKSRNYFVKLKNIFFFRCYSQKGLPFRFWTARKTKVLPCAKIASSVSITICAFGTQTLSSKAQHIYRYMYETSPALPVKQKLDLATHHYSGFPLLEMAVWGVTWPQGWWIRKLTAARLVGIGRGEEIGPGFL